MLSSLARHLLVYVNANEKAHPVHVKHVEIYYFKQN